MMSEAPERVYMDPDIKFPECEKQYGSDVEYIRADLVQKVMYDVIVWADELGMYSDDPSELTPELKRLRDCYIKVFGIGY